MRGLAVRVLALSFFVMSIAAAQADNPCESVYKEATRNLSVASREKSTRNYYYSEHCEASGEIRQSSLGLNLDVVISNIPFGASLTGASSKEKMQNFCKTQTTAASLDEGDFSFESTVVTAALTSYNQCLSILQRGNINLTHSFQRPASVIISGQFTDKKTRFVLQGISKPSFVHCYTTEVSLFGGATSLDEPKQYELKDDFSVSCERKKTDAGEKDIYERAEIGLATNHGPYTVVMLEEELLGFRLASEASQQNAALQEEINGLRGLIKQKDADIAAGLARIDAVSGEAYLIYRGSDWSFRAGFGKDIRTVGCGDPADDARKVCPGKAFSLKQIHTSNGGQCGHNIWMLSCLNK